MLEWRRFKPQKYAVLGSVYHSRLIAMDGNSVLLLHGGNTVCYKQIMSGIGSHGMDSLLFSSGLEFPKSVL